MRTAEVVASRILFWGGVLSMLVMTVGVARYVQAPTAPVVFTSVAQVVHALARWRMEPLAIVASGIVLLLLTPFVAVMAVFGVFLAAGERRYAVVAGLLLGALLISLTIGRP